MKRSLKLNVPSIHIFAYLTLVSFFQLHSFVGDVVPGQSLWCIDKRIAETTDIIESKVCIIESIIETLVTSTTTCPCAPTAISSADIVAGVITLSQSGNYCLSEDVTADILINGNCITLDLNNRCVTGTIMITSDDVKLFDGTLMPPAPVANPVTSSLVIDDMSARTIVSNLTIENTASAGTGINGRTGVEILGDDIQFLNSLVTAGAASEGTTGGTGGYGLIVADGATVANNVIVTNCLFASGNGGASSDPDTPGGDAGAGILIRDLATETEIINCTILSTGLGGGGGSGNSDGGDGGTGIVVESGAIDTVVRSCTIRNTGAGGDATGTGVAGVDGRAVFDSVIIVANLSMFYQNFAHNIANTIKYALQGSLLEQGVAIANPPTATVVNPYANVFVS